MTDQWTERLSEYIDGDLAADERATLEAHLATCAECRSVLRELEAVAVRAQAIEDRSPATNLWPGIAERLERRTPVVPLHARRRRFTLSLTQLAAAAAIVVALGLSAGLWLGTRGRAAPPATALTPAALTPAAEVSYDKAVAELEAALQQHRTQLDTATVRVIQENLAVIDQAIAEAKAALAADPANVYLNTHLAQTQRQKLDLLQRAVALTQG